MDLKHGFCFSGQQPLTWFKFFGQLGSFVLFHAYNSEISLRSEWAGLRDLFCLFSFVLQDCSLVLGATSQLHFSDLTSQKACEFFSVSAFIPGLLSGKRNCAAEMGTLHYSAALGQVFRKRLLSVPLIIWVGRGWRQKTLSERDLFHH